MIYVISVDEPIKTSKTIRFPTTYEKEMIEFLRGKRLKGSIYELGGRIVGRF